MTISIIIPTHNRAEQVSVLLESVARQDFPSENLEVLLISNLRDKILRKRIPYWKGLFFDFKYKEVGLVGVNKARNMGIRFAGGDILYFLDDDCMLPKPDHLQNLVLKHKNKPFVIGIGGGYKANEDLLYGLDKFYHEHSEKWIKGHVFDNKNTSQLIGGNASYKREVFDKGFYFNPLIAFGGSEEDFNESLKEESYKLIYDEDIWVFHIVKLTAFSLVKKGFLQGFGSFDREYQSHQDRDKAPSMKEGWAFSFGAFSFYSFIYNVCFKLGYFWGVSFSKKTNVIFRFVYFIFLILKSRIYFLKEYFFPWFYGSVFLRVFGRLWYVLGWFYGSVFLRVFGRLWYVLGWFYGHILLFLFHHSPPMKMYYFTKYQYYKRIKPFLNKRK